MGGVAVVVDSGADLPKEPVELTPDAVVPIRVRFGDVELTDEEAATPAVFWARCRTSPRLPMTAAPSIGAYQAAFADCARRGATGVVAVTLSSELSASYQAAVAAGPEAPIPVRVVDSRSASIGQGLVARRLLAAAHAGETLERLADLAEEVIARLRVYGALDTLDHLRRGGRIGAAQALVGSVFSFKPLIEVAEGTVRAAGRARTRARSFQALAELVAAGAPDGEILVVHGDAPDVERFLATLEAAAPSHPVAVADLGPVIGTHTGPGTIGVAFESRRAVPATNPGAPGRSAGSSQPASEGPDPSGSAGGAPRR